MASLHDNDNKKKRLILPAFLSRQTCEELAFIHRSCSTVGYRPHVLSTTLLHLVATNCACLIMPFVQIREKLKEVVEEFFDCHYEVSVEFTGLISWMKGGKIGWHSDDNRPYLKQRHYTVVCYLNSYDEDFKGGLFHFRDGEPTTIAPRTGDVVIYTADEDNIHCVDEITDGERITLALWFTRDSAHNEDVKLINLLSGTFGSVINLLQSRGSFPVSAPHEGNEVKRRTYLWDTIPSQKSEGSVLGSVSCLDSLYDVVSNDLQPFAPSNDMYWVNLNAFSEDLNDISGKLESPVVCASGYDIRLYRLLGTGFEFSLVNTSTNSSEKGLQGSSSSSDLGLTDALDKPLRLKFMGIEIPELFFNSLHALQVVQFFQWSVNKLSINHPDEEQRSGFRSMLHRERRPSHKECSENFGVSVNDPIKCSKTEIDRSLTIQEFIKAFSDWRHYVCRLWMSLIQSFPLWKENQMIFLVR